MKHIHTSDTKHILLKSKFEKNSKGRDIAEELLKNYGKYDTCCNPKCRDSIPPECKAYMGFDGIFCSLSCHNTVETVIYDQWSLC